MGLVISVGTLADFLENDPEGGECFEGHFEIMNTVRAAARLPLHVAHAHCVVSSGGTAMPGDGRTGARSRLARPLCRRR